MPKEYSKLLNESDQVAFSIDFEKMKGDPSRVFLAMAEVSQSVQKLQGRLSVLLPGAIGTELVLADVEKGSVVAKFIARRVGMDFPDQQDVDVADVFIYVMQRVVEIFSSANKDITFQDIEEACFDIERRAVEVPGNELFIGKMQPEDIIDFAVGMKKAASFMSANDELYFSTRLSDRVINKNALIDEEMAEELLTVKMVINFDHNAVLKIKKPDYLGKSKWVMVYQKNGKSIDVKIDHTEWLDNFQRNELNDFISPGDDVKGLLELRLGFNRNGEVISEDYVLREVFCIVHGGKGGRQRGFNEI